MTHPKYDLGGNDSTPDGWLSVDILSTADIVCDITQGLPFETETVGAIRAFDFLEHIPHCRNSTCRHEACYCVVGLINDIHRVLIPGGEFYSMTPSTSGRGAFQDPTHCSFWNANSFWYYMKEQQARFVPGITARFNGHVYESYPSAWHRQHHIPYVYANLTKI